MGHVYSLSNINTEVFKDAANIGGPKELNALAKELNGMTREQLRDFGPILGAINAIDASPDHRILPVLNLAGGESSDFYGTKTTLDFSLEKEFPNGKTVEIYHREFGLDHGVTTDTKFDPITMKAASIETTQPNGLHTLTLVDDKRQK